MTPDEIWSEILTDSEVLAARPDFRFDPAFYQALYQETKHSGLAPLDHYLQHGLKEGRFATSYQRLKGMVPDIDGMIANLVTDTRLLTAIAAQVPGACELAFELIALGSPADARISDFSADYYVNLYPDIGKAMLNPFMHFVQHGQKEGRRSLSDLRKNQHAGHRVFNPELPTCLICVHEFSRTGAPIVGLELAQHAAGTHNVVVAALRGGDLLERFSAIAVTLVVSANPLEDFAHFVIEGMDRIEFAILNSVECFMFVPLLVGRKIPFASYLHEYTDYTLPAYKPTFIALFSDLLVFSSDQVRKSWTHVFNEIDFDTERDSLIIPQAELRVGRVTPQEHARSREGLSQMIGRDCTGKRIVLGAGHVHWRKGTDLFVMAAQIARKRDPDTLFVWIGDGLNHEDFYFGVWIDKHMREAGANRPDGNLFFIPAGDYYHDVCRAADVMFLSSRLDPLPNVVFDAVAFGGRVVLFENASGFTDAVYTARDGMVSVPYGDLDAACTALLATPTKSDRPLAVTAEDRADAQSLFSRITDALHLRLAAQRHFTQGAGQYDVPVMAGNTEAQATARLHEREKLWTYRRRFVWRNRAEAEAALATSDNWTHRQARIGTYASIEPAEVPPFSVHIHAYYTDDLDQDLQRHIAYSHARRIVVTTDTPQKAREIEKIMARRGLGAEIVLGGNTGRDILPFMRLFTAKGAAAEVPDDEVWCHVHQKKSIGSSAAGDIWRKFLMTILLGDAHQLSSALLRAADPSVGLVAAFDPYIVGWAGSQRLLPAIAPLFPEPLPPHPILFPIGNMFVTRPSVVRRMNALFGPHYPWPNEPIANDGTVFHMIERLWPAVAAMEGLAAEYIAKNDQRRS